MPAQESTRENYNRLSRWYDIFSGGFEARFRAAGLARLAARPGESVLELGPGTGHALLALAQDVGPDGRVAAIDISEQMLAACRKRLDRAGLLDRVELRLGDARKLPWPDHHFDAAFGSFAIETFAAADLPAVLAELRRVLRPGSRICVTAMSADGRDTLMMHLYRWSHRLLPRLVDCAPISLAALLGQAGFEIRSQEVENRWGLNVAVALAATTA